MVRVISVHHFANQNISTVEQPTACTVAPPDRLLLALSSHCIEVRDLQTEGDVMFTFPTVDEVAQLKYCLNGDYVASLETKHNRQNRELNFVRVYINWDSVAALQQSKMNNSGASLGLSECGMVQPMRARIAGRVTPTTNQSELGSLEMIEIPMKRNPHSIEVCQVSGNIMILSKKSIIIYKFGIKTHDISKIKFIDFEELQICFELCFVPTQMSICENYIACLNKDTMHLFRVVNVNQKATNGESLETDFNFKYDDDKTIDFEKLLAGEILNTSKQSITVNLPSITRANSIIYKYSPFMVCDKDLTVSIKSTSPIEVNLQNYRIEDLIQLKLKPIVIDDAQNKISEEFKILVMKPLYVDGGLNKKQSTESSKILKSSYRQNLHSIACFIVTQQEGYHFQFCDQDTFMDVDNCMAVYPFTSPVQKVVLEDYYLHALTDAGLESYTLRVGHQLCKYLLPVDNINIACPPISESICLVGLRPFLGVEQVLLADNHLVLLASGDTSPTHSIGSNGSSTASYWTMYNLELPSLRMIFNDISIVANSYRFTSPQTYCHLLSEAHMILRMKLMLLKWYVADGSIGVLKAKKNASEDTLELYRTSCALLADHFIMSPTETDYILSVPYYSMSGAGPYDVIKRIKKIQEQSNCQNINGLIYYLKTILFNNKTNLDSFKTCAKQNFAEAVLELFQKHNFAELPKLILKVHVLQEYNTDKLINILETGTMSTENEDKEKLLALVILYILKGNEKKACESLGQLHRDDLYTLLLEYWELLFEKFGNKKGSNSFSELTKLFISSETDLLAELFHSLVNEKKHITLSKLLKIFVEFLPSNIGQDLNYGSIVLQRTLELHFKSFFQKYDLHELSRVTYDRSSHDGIKLLVRSYLSQMQLLQIKDKSDRKKSEKEFLQDLFEKEEAEANKEALFLGMQQTHSCNTYLFYHLRYKYLDKMMPSLLDAKSYAEMVMVQKKIQALLCSKVLPNQVILEVNTFLALNKDLTGREALLSIIMNINDAVLCILDSYPSCIIQFAKDRFSKPDEWKFLITTMQQRLLNSYQNKDESSCYVFQSYLNDILTHVAVNMNLESLLMVIPEHMNYSTSVNGDDGKIKKTETKDEPSDDILKEIQNYDPYISLCKETMHANQIKKLITTTGQQLLCTLNLQTCNLYVIEPFVLKKI